MHTVTLPFFEPVKNSSVHGLQTNYLPMAIVSHCLNNKLTPTAYYQFIWGIHAYLFTHV